VLPETTWRVEPLTLGAIGFRLFLDEAPMKGFDTMKYIAILTAFGLGSAALLAAAAEHDGSGKMMERLKAADTNGDGMISKEEAKALPRILKNFDAIDANHDGQITMEELRAFHQSRRGEHWKKLDTNGDGKISKEEAKAAPRLLEHFDAIDTNHDGFLTPDELKAAHGKGRGEKREEK
jgi:Ca2+-binding EF-hand superfamily protein